MILGIGVDSIEISRVVKAMEKEHFVHRIFTEKERAEMEHAKRRGASDGAARKKAEEMGITDWKISITNTKEVATAFVIAVADDVKE